MGCYSVCVLIPLFFMVMEVVIGALAFDIGLLIAGIIQMVLFVTIFAVIYKNTKKKRR